jgi:signal peptidase I
VVKGMAKKILDKVFQIIFNILFLLVFLILGFAMYSYIMINVFNKDYVNVFGYTFFEVGSGSMGDEIHISDMIIVKIDSSYDVNDVITYYSDGDFITHRIVSIDKDKIICRGDANSSNDSPINSSAVLGKVIYVVKNFGIWKEILMTPKVFISMIITLFLFSFTFSYNKKKPKKKKKVNNEDYSDSYSHITDPEIPFKKGDSDKSV